MEDTSPAGQRWGSGFDGEAGDLVIPRPQLGLLAVWISAIFPITRVGLFPRRHHHLIKEDDGLKGQVSI